MGSESPRRKRSRVRQGLPLIGLQGRYIQVNRARSLAEQARVRDASQFAHLLAEAAVEEELDMVGLFAHEGAAPGKTLDQVFIHETGDGLTHGLAANAVSLADIHFGRQHLTG